MPVARGVHISYSVLSGFKTILLIIKSNIFHDKKIKVWCTEFECYLFTFIYYSRYSS
jgi:hypothetical protein